MPYKLSDKLVVGVASSALFDTRKSQQVFKEKGVEGFVRHQLALEQTPYNCGTAFPLIKSLLGLNQLFGGERVVEVLVLSQNSPRASIRILNSVKHHGLDITRGAFTSGNAVSYLHAYNVALFLSKNVEDVTAAMEQGVAGGIIYDPPGEIDVPTDQLRVAFDGDAVVFSDQSQRIYDSKGIEAFHAHESENAKKPLPEGPFAPLLHLIAKLQSKNKESGIPESGASPIRTALVTARNSPSDERVVRTFEAWRLELDEIHFLGGVEKPEILRRFRPHIFFDDQSVHAEGASTKVPSCLVPVLDRATNTDESEAEKVTIPETTSNQEIQLRPVNQRDFLKRARSVFEPYSPTVGSRRILSTEIKDFLNRSSKFDGKKRAEILLELEKYSLEKELQTHDPILNREGLEVPAKVRQLVKKFI